MAVELSTTQFQVCQEANGQFCSIATPFQPLANPPSCIAALYASEHSGYYFKMLIANMKSIRYKFANPDSTRCLDSYNTTCSSSKHHDIDMSQEGHGDYHNTKTSTHTACSTTSSNFYLPPRYETLTLDVNVSLNMANLHMINISTQDFHIWQHLGSNRSDVQLQHLTTIPSIPVHKIYQQMLNNTSSIMPFDMNKDVNRTH